MFTAQDCFALIIFHRFTLFMNSSVLFLHLRASLLFSYSVFSLSLCFNSLAFYLSSSICFTHPRHSFLAPNHFKMFFFSEQLDVFTRFHFPPHHSPSLPNLTLVNPLLQFSPSCVLPFLPLFPACSHFRIIIYCTVILSAPLHVTSQSRGTPLASVFSCVYCVSESVCGLTHLQYLKPWEQDWVVFPCTLFLCPSSSSAPLPLYLIFRLEERCVFPDQSFPR